MLIHLYTIYGCFGYPVPELSNWNRDYILQSLIFLLSGPIQESANSWIIEVEAEILFSIVVMATV